MPAETFTVTTDASDVGLGAILEQGGRVLAYKSRSLTASEKNYSTIQKECLALVYALKEFRHYLLARRFAAVTDHNPLVWLAGQKTLGILARWAIALQEYDLDLRYQRGEENSHADALSRRQHSDHLACLVGLQSSVDAPDLRALQLGDPVLQVFINAFESSPQKAPVWRRGSLMRFRKMRGQLKLIDGVLYRHFGPVRRVTFYMR